MRAPSLAAAVCMALFPAGLVAQDAPTPERIVEGFGAWEMRCQRLDPADPGAPLACEVTQETLLQNSPQPITRIAIGRPAPDAPLTAVVQLPLGLWLPAGASLDLAGQGNGLPLAILRCLPQGCIAELPLTEPMIAALSDESLTESALSFEMQPGSPARVPVVHQGFAAALAAMATRMP
jgi:invasion protein IalB